MATKEKDKLPVKLNMTDWLVMDIIVDRKLKLIKVKINGVLAYVTGLGLPKEEDNMIANLFRLRIYSRRKGIDSRNRVQPSVLDANRLLQSVLVSLINWYNIQN